jgi:hypothetical protein
MKSLTGSRRAEMAVLSQVASPNRRLSRTVDSQDADIRVVDPIEQAISLASLGLEKRFANWFAEAMAFEGEAMVMSILPQIVDCLRCSFIPRGSASR